MLEAFDGGRLFGATFGEGRPQVVALHGWQRSHKDFARLLDALGVGAVALDLPGFGASPPPPEAWTTARYAEALVPVLTSWAAPVVVVGHSFGGRVAVRLAAAHPELVRALVLTGMPHLVGSDAPVRTPPVAYRVARALHRRGVLSDARMDDLRRRRGSADYNAAEGVLREVLVAAVNERYDDDLRRIHQPVELVWGDDDTAAPLPVAEAAAAVLANAKLTVVPGAGHFTPQTAVDALRAAVERQL